MTRLCALVLVVLGALVLPGVAAAKEVQSVKICGASACKTFTPQNTDPDRLMLFAEGGSDDTLPPAAPSSFYTASMTVDAGKQTDSWKVFYVPSARRMAGVGEYGVVHWMRPKSDRVFAEAVRGLEPFPKPELTRAAVGSNAVSGDASSYLRLYEVAGTGPAIPQDADWIPIELRSSTPSPWTLEDNHLAYSPSAKLLQRGSEIIRLPDSIAADVAQARALDTGARSLLPWLVLGGLVAVLVLLAAVGAVARRRWSAPAARPTPASATLAAIAALVAALALPGVAAAKELKQVQLCGPSSCTTIDDEKTLREIPGGSEQTLPPPPPGPFYEVRSTVDAEGEQYHFTSYYVPSADAMAGEEDEEGNIVWRPIFGDPIQLMKRLVRGIEPFPAPRLTRVTVGGREVADPESYLRLLEVEPAGPLTELADDWVPVDFRSSTPSPWTNGPRELMFSPSTDMLERNGALFPIEADLAADVEAGRTLAEDGTRWLPWVVLGALVLALLALAAVGWRTGAGRVPDPRLSGAS